MASPTHRPTHLSACDHATARRWPLAGLTLLLAACGGGLEPAEPAAAEARAAAEAMAVIEAQPAFHMAAVALDAPGDADADGSSASALQAPHAQAIDASARSLDTARLTPEGLGQLRRTTLGAGNRAAAAAPSSIVTYTPAQVRAAYGLPALPPPGTALSAAAAAALGSGATVYIIAARHHPNAVVDLNTFSAKFGVPACTKATIALNAALPLAPAAAGSGCSIAVVYSNAAGTMNTAAPPYDAGWASEMALDLQWAHAIAPLARLVLIEAPDPTLTALSGAVKLANAMGPGVVSMSFGASEGSYVATADGVFRTAGMSYLAATGDSGPQVSWPAASANVLAVGGTTLAFSGSTRSEAVWPRTGGGVSAYVALPAYQSGVAVPGASVKRARGVADVAFNADPATGQYVAFTPPGGNTAAPGWYSMGGTSLATPQWAGLAAVANAQRRAAGRAPLGALHPALYRGIAAVPGSYVNAFADITRGSNGSCQGCTAAAGYDLATGLGTPQGARLLPLLAAY